MQLLAKMAVFTTTIRCSRYVVGEMELRRGNGIIEMMRRSARLGRRDRPGQLKSYDYVNMRGSQQLAPRIHDGPKLGDQEGREAFF